MNKQSTYGKRIIVILFFSISRFAQAQPGLHITNSNINMEVVNNVYSFTAGACLLTIAPYINVNATGQFTPGLSPIIPLSKIKIKPTEIGSGVSLLAGASEKPLALAPASIYTALLGALTASGPVKIQYRIPSIEMTNYAWKAGIFTVPITFTTPGGTLCLGSSSYPTTFTLTVDPFISMPAVPNIQLHVNSFSFYRNTPIANAVVVNSTQTIPFALRLKSANNTFQYTNGYPGAADPLANVNAVTAQIASPTAYNSIDLSTSDQLLTPAIGQTVPIGNKLANTLSFAVTPGNLKLMFMQKGNYTASLALTAKDGSSQTAATATLTPDISIIVDDMGELKINDPVVNLDFSSLTDYQSGKSVDMPNHLTISKTSAYDVYVSSSSSNLVNGDNKIPVSCIQIGPGSGQAGVSTIRLSTTPKKLISAAEPCLDRNVNIRYQIGLADVQNILGKATGMYSTTITYSFTAP